MQRRVLILSCNTGNGHNAAASAMLEEFTSHGVWALMMDSLSFAGKRAPAAASRIYTGIVNTAPQVFGAAYKAGDILSLNRTKSIIYLANMEYATKVRNYIDANKITDIVSTHLFASEAVTRIKRKWKSPVKLYNIATDYACIPFWQDTEPDAFFIPASDLTDEFIKKGFKPRLLYPFGIPVSAAFSEQNDRIWAREQLHLPVSGSIFLIATGSMGYGNIYPLIERILSRNDKAGAVVLGGNNTTLKNSLREKYNANPNVRIIDFTNRVSLYMDAADVVFTKPGGLTTTEVAVKNKPLALTAPIPGCETINLKYFTSRGMSVADDNLDRLLDKAFTLCEDKGQQDAMLTAQRNYINPTARKNIYEFICNN